MATQRVQLQPLDSSHAAAMLKLVDENRDHFSPWDPAVPADFYSLAFWINYAKTAQDDARTQTSQRWVIQLTATQDTIGTINITQIARGPFQSAMLGYKLGKAYEGKGLMFEALTLAISHAFNDLKLHRLQASFVTHNERSARVLKRLQFEEIGVAKDYLFTNGQWSDHVMMQLVNPQFDSAVFSN